jgi:hypothetical protein
MLARLSQPLSRARAITLAARSTHPKHPRTKEAKEIRLLLAEAKRAYKAIAEASPEERGRI